MNSWSSLTHLEADRFAVIKRPVIILALLTLLIVGGTLGFRIVNETSWLESLYLAVITLTTLGCRDPATSNATMAFVVIYLGFGLGLFSYSLFSLGQSLLDPQFRQFWKQRRMINKIDSLKDHHIVCGFGRMGRTICEYLDRRNRPFVVIDLDGDVLEAHCTAHNWLYIVGDATDDVHLQNAGISRASSLASVLPSDSDNTYVVLSARMLNNGLQIVARASDEKAIQKIERAGATRVISPFSSGGMKMARFMINPSVESFVEVADKHDSDLELVDIQIKETSSLVGKKLSETKLAEQGVMILAIRRANGEQLLPPPGASILHAGDNLFAFGHANKVAMVISNCEE
ncbi:potassium channel family protein [Rubinisphaera italica]|uniref:Voltage-gated potassium channel Kch n=1 Tax=Rubinisphaera italica TaxID=2527969 RepID=A0A5C5XGR4_9PLAN|nr:potassium channel protein [Rubinisphaera italica]TWT61591.1 Voltage-gated potassium channel Kch [Rubinisphaera italica]